RIAADADEIGSLGTASQKRIGVHGRVAGGEEDGSRTKSEQGGTAPNHLAHGFLVPRTKLRPWADRGRRACEAPIREADYSERFVVVPGQVFLSFLFSAVWQ